MDLKGAADIFLNNWQKESGQKLTIALFGQPGAGKSSLINELLGKKVATVSVETDTTKKAQVIEGDEVVLVDLPGYDTSEFPTNNYFSMFNPMQYDLFLCVFSNKLKQADVDFFRKLTLAQRECVFVRNKIDGLYDDNKTIAELKAEIKEDVAKQLGTVQTVIFTSCKPTTPAAERGIPELQTAISLHLPPAMQDKFMRSAKAYTQEILDEKRRLALAAIKKASVMAAGNGLNPVIGVDVGIDVHIMSVMYAKIRKVFGITELELEGRSSKKSALVEKVARGVKKDSIISVMRKTLSTKMEKRFAKYIPLVGQATAVGLSAGSMYYLGSSYLDSCYEYASKRLEMEIKMRS